MAAKPSNYREHLLSLMVPVTPEQDAACRYLEARGYVFLVEFVVINRACRECARIFDRARRPKKSLYDGMTEQSFWSTEVAAKVQRARAAIKAAEGQ
jgi:hypothetical protein